MTRLTEERLREIRSRVARATPGPWMVEEFANIDDAHEAGAFRWTSGDPYDGGSVGAVYRLLPDGGNTGLPGCVEASLPTAALIAAAPTDLTALLAEVDALRAERDEERATRFRVATMATDASGEVASLRERMDVLRKCYETERDTKHEYAARAAYLRGRCVQAEAALLAADRLMAEHLGRGEARRYSEWREAHASALGAASAAQSGGPDA